MDSQTDTNPGKLWNKAEYTLQDSFKWTQIDRCIFAYL